MYHPRVSEGASDGEAGPAEAPEPKKAKPLRACERCGNFAKRTNVLDRRLCAECRDKTLHPAALGPITAGALLSGTTSLVGSIFLPLVLVCGFPSVLLFAIGLAGSGADVDPRAFEALDTIVPAFLGPLTSGLAIRIAWGAIRNEPPAFGTHATAALAGYGRLFVTQLVVGISIFAWSLALIIPGILRTLDTVVALEIAVVEERSASDSMGESVARMREHRGSIFGGLFMLGAFALGWIIPVALVVGAEDAITAIVISVATVAYQVGAQAFGVVLYTRDRLARRF